MKINDLKKILKVFLTLQWAKELPRQGFIAMGFKRNEADSVAAHSFSTALLSYFLAKQLQKTGEKIDPEKVLKMGLVHDIGETIVGDVGTFVKGMAGGVFKDIEEEGVKALVKGLDSEEEIIKLVSEYNDRQSLEARVVKVADNSGAKRLMVIQPLGGSGKRLARLGEKFVAAVKGADPNGQVKDGEVVRAVLVRSRKEIRRLDGSYIKFDENAAVVVDKSGELRATRVFGPIAREVREKGFTKIASLASEVW